MPCDSDIPWCHNKPQDAGGSADAFNKTTTTQSVYCLFICVSVSVWVFIYCVYLWMSVYVNVSLGNFSFIFLQINPAAFPPSIYPEPTGSDLLCPAARRRLDSDGPKTRPDEQGKWVEDAAVPLGLRLNPSADFYSQCESLDLGLQLRHKRPNTKPSRELQQDYIGIQRELCRLEM